MRTMSLPQFTAESASGPAARHYWGRVAGGALDASMIEPSAKYHLQCSRLCFPWIGCEMYCVLDKVG